MRGLHDILRAAIGVLAVFFAAEIEGLPSIDIPTAHTPGFFSGGPIKPLGCGNTYLPTPILENCTDPIRTGIPNIRGHWAGQVDGKDHWERIEQCDDRIVWTSGCVVHDFRHANGKLRDGVNDYSAVACVPIRVSAVFNASCSVLSPYGLFKAVTRCLQPDGSLTIDWGGKKGFLRRVNRTEGVEACDKSPPE